MSVAVLWTEDDGPLMVGKLELVDGSLRLEGTNGHVVHVSVPLVAVVAARIVRTRLERLQGMPALLLELRGNRKIRISALSGAGVLHELADAVGAR